MKIVSIIATMTISFSFLVLIACAEDDSPEIPYGVFERLYKSKQIDSIYYTENNWVKIKIAEKTIRSGELDSILGRSLTDSKHLSKSGLKLKIISKEAFEKDLFNLLQSSPDNKATISIH